MKPVTRSDRKARPIKVNFNDLENLQVLLPPHLARLPINLTIVFEEGRPKVGFTKPGLNFESKLDEVKRLGQIPMIVNAIKPADSTRQAATMVASLAPNADPKYAPEIGGALIQVQQFLKNINQLEQVVKDRPNTGFMHEEAKITLLKIIPILRGFIKQTVESATERKKFSDILEENHFPKDVANRLIGGSVNFAQNDLIRAFYPSDPTKHLSFSLKEAKAGAHELFGRVLSLPAQRCIDYFQSKDMELYLGSFSPDLKVLDYRIQVPCPLPLKDIFKARNRRFMGPTGNEAYRILWTHNCVFTYPQWICTGGMNYSSKDLAVDMLGIDARSIPTDMKGWEDIIPEGKMPHIEYVLDKKFARMFDSFDLSKWAQIGCTTIERKTFNFTLPEVKEYKITIDERKIVKVKPKIPTIQVGMNRLHQPAKDLIQEVNKVNPAMSAAVRNFMTNFAPALQEVAANAIFARLETGIEEEPLPFGIGSNSPQEEDHEKADE